MSDQITGLTKILQDTGAIKFLGCSVLNFTSQIGWGLDNSTLTVELVEDCENNDRFWGRDQELIGTAKYFDIREWGGDFRFSGIITSWSENKSSSGQTFSVTMQDAKQLLSGVTVMTDTYSWAPVTYYNFYNVLAKFEGLVLLGNCPDFGLAKSNERGMNYQNILKALLTIGLEDQLDPKQRFACFSPTRGVAPPGTADFVIDIGWRWSKFEDRFYQQRNDALPLGPSFYKIPGTMNLLEMFNNICDLTGRNLYIDMYYDFDVGKNVIVVRCIHLIDTYAGNYDTLITEFDGGASSLSYGRELNNPKTRTMLLGDNYSYLAQATHFVPCFGTYDRPMSYGGFTWNNRSPIAPPSTIAGTWLTPQGTHSSCGFWVYVDARQLNSNLHFPLVNSAGVPVQGFWISESDLQAAIASESLWRDRVTRAKVLNNGNLLPDPIISPPGSLSYILMYNHPYLLSLMVETLKKYLELLNESNRLTQGNVQFYQNLMGIINSAGPGALWNRIPTPQGNTLQLLQRDINSIYNFVLDQANSHYGKTYLFRFNEKICAKWTDPETSSGEMSYSSVPTNEGGWIDPGHVALGLGDPELGTFRNDDGRITAFALWTKGQIKGMVGDPTTGGDRISSGGLYNGVLELEGINPSDYITDGANVWMKAQIEETVYFVQDSTAANGYVPAGIIEFPSPAFIRTETIVANLGAEQVLSSLAALLNFEDYANDSGSQPTSVQTPGNFYYTIKSYDFNSRGKWYAVGDHVTWGGDSYGKVARVGPLGEIQTIMIVNGGNLSAGYHNMTIIPVVSGWGQGASGWGNAIAVHNNKYCSLAYPNNNNRLTNTGAYDAMAKTGTIDANIKGISQQAITPMAAAIPMRSNNTIYGPWFSYNFFSNYGGVNVEQDKDFAPWKFGSTSLMRIAAQARAETAFESNQQPLVISENGQVTVPGLPMFSLADQITVDGAKRGPLVNNVNVTFGDQGITSTYDFKTFSRKFGNLTQIQTEQMKLIGENKNKQLKFLRENFLSNSRLYRKASNTYQLRKSQKQEMASRKNTSQRMMIGQNVNSVLLNPYNPKTSGIGQQSLSVIESADKLGYEISTEYNQKSIMSLDGLYSPVSIYGGGAGLPRFPEVKPIIPDHLKYTVAPQPPMLYKGKSINAINTARDFMNPLTNRLEGLHHHSGVHAGHNIEIVGREDKVPVSGLPNSAYAPEVPEKYSNDYRFMAIRGPIVLHQWGYDTQGKPIPNRTDDPKEIINNGNWRSENLTEQFYQDWLQKPNLWPAAPIDLRFDRERGVWTAPPAYKIVVVEAENAIGPYGSGTARVVNSYQGNSYGTTMVNASGVNVVETGVSVVLEDRIGSPMAADEKQYAYFDTFSSKYLLISGQKNLYIGKFCNQWPSIGNVKDPANAVKEVTLYQAGKCPTGVDSCPWLLEPITSLVNGIPTPIVVKAINLFSNVAAAEYETKWCVLMKNGKNYYLLSAEC